MTPYTMNVPFSGKREKADVTAEAAYITARIKNDEKCPCVILQKAKNATQLLETRPKMCTKSAYVFENTLQLFVGSSRRDRRREKGRKKNAAVCGVFFVTACCPTDPRSPAKAVPAFWERFSWLPLQQGVQPRQARLFSLLPERQFPDGFCPDGGKL